MTIYLIYKNRKILKELTKFQVLGVLITFLITIYIAFICIFYGGNWIAGKFTNMIVKTTIQYIVIFITLFICVSILYKILKKITNGVLPKN
jgi:Kef-type K+ transport system membrane component KefB